MFVLYSILFYSFFLIFTPTSKCLGVPFVPHPEHLVLSDFPFCQSGGCYTVTQAGLGLQEQISLSVCSHIYCCCEVHLVGYLSCEIINALYVV